MTDLSEFCFGVLFTLSNPAAAVCLCVSALAPAAVSGSVKVWGRQLSLDLAGDWVGGSLPCAGQVALLPDTLAVSSP